MGNFLERRRVTSFVGSLLTNIACADAGPRAEAETSRRHGARKSRSTGAAELDRAKVRRPESDAINNLSIDERDAMPPTGR